MKHTEIIHPYLGQFTRSFILHSEEGDILIDTGLYEGKERINGALKSPVTAVLSTHGHWDHTGGHDYFQKQGAKIYASGRDRRTLSDLTFQWNLLYEQFSGDFLIPQERRMVYKKNAGYEVEADIWLQGNETLVFGSEKIDVLSCAGHSAGSVCYKLENGHLFTGDIVCGNGFFQVIPQIESISEYVNTLQSLMKIDVECAFTGHWIKALNNGEYHNLIQEGLRFCERAYAWADDYLKNAKDPIYLGAAAIDLCEKEGGKQVGSGACITTLALLKEFSDQYEAASACCSRYMI